MGLFHTFQGGCEGGDLIGDTAPEKTEASGCDIGRGTLALRNSVDFTFQSHFWRYTYLNFFLLLLLQDTCPGGGRDPIHNRTCKMNPNALWIQLSVTQFVSRSFLYRHGL